MCVCCVGVVFCVVGVVLRLWCVLLFSFVMAFGMFDLFVCVVLGVVL